MTFSYDEDADVLYVTFAPVPPGYSVQYVESEDGDVMRIDANTQRVLGYTISFFSRRASREDLTVPGAADVTLAPEMLARQNQGALG